MRIGIDIDGCPNDVHHTLINKKIRKTWLEKSYGGFLWISIMKVSQILN